MLFKLFKARPPKLGKLFVAGEVIAQEGDVAINLHIIQSGLAEVYRTGFAGNRIRIALLKSGDMFGSMALFDNKPFYSSIQALDDTWVLLIDKKSIMRRIYEDPSLVLRIMENLSARVRRQSDEILELTNDYQAAIGGLAAIAATFRTSEQGQSSDNIAQLVCHICEKLREWHCFPDVIDATFQANMKIASFFYDIGNAGLPGELLTKPGALGKEEKELLKTHIHIGSNVLSKVAKRTQGAAHFLLAAELAQYHHEKFDGSGYLGLRAAHIPISARIIAVVDVYTALLAERPHRKPLTQPQALAFIMERSATHFDPQVTKAFAAVVRPSV